MMFGEMPPVKAVIRTPKNEYENARAVLFAEKIEITKEYPKLLLFEIRTTQRKLNKLKSENPDWFFYRDLRRDDL